MAAYTISNTKDLFVVKNFSKTYSSGAIASNAVKTLKYTDMKDSNNVSIANTSIPNHTLCAFTGFNNVSVKTNCISVSPAFADGVMAIHNKTSSTTPSSSGTVTLNLLYVRSDCLTEERIWQ